MKGLNIGANVGATITLKGVEAAKVSLGFPNLRKHKVRNNESEWQQETQPVLVNNRVPGLVTKWKAPFEEQVEGNR